MNNVTSPKIFCFVLMPFEESFDDIYQLGIKQPCIELGLYCERVDEQIFHESIIDRIYNQIAKADIIIADLSGRNPNVFYEVGYAHALGKKIIMLTHNANDIPFDLKQFPHIIYNNKISMLKLELTKRLRWSIANLQNASISSNKIELEIFHKKENLSKSKVFYVTPSSENILIALTIYNASPKTFESEDFNIGIITNESFSKQLQHYINHDLPDGSRVYMISHIQKLFPGASQTFHTELEWLNEKPDEFEEHVIVRVFTNMGTRDYPLILKSK